MANNRGLETSSQQAADRESSSGQNAISPPAISLPKGGGAIRGMGEKFAANPVTGTGSLTVPIATSPGRSGFGPQLALSYDSGAGNGPFGFGWDLSLPSITRKTDKGLPKYHDADESDVFILSGTEDLVPVFKQDQAGDWVRDAEGNLEYQEVERDGYLVRRYRPRIEGLFARIERWTHQATGEIHWRSITRDNITTLYGKTAESRISYPSDPSRVFTWLICESYDDKGNAIVYEYVSEDSAGIDLSQAHEQNRSDECRSANRYLKRIKYGNLPSRLVEPDLSLLNWLFEVVFDYDEGHYQALPADPGQHQFVRATIEKTGDWPVRQDPFSSYRAGFEVRTYRLCRRVLMFHHFPHELGVDDYLVRSTQFTYHESPIASFITSVTQSGYVRQENDRYLKKSLPPLEFTYSQADIQGTIQEVEPDSFENLPYGLDGAGYQWVDLDGEGLSGILTEQAGGWFYKRNLSPITTRREKDRETTSARFGPLELVARKPSLAALNGGGQQLLDLAGDGQLDLVLFDSTTPGFYERTTDEDWAPFRSFATLPSINWADPNRRFVDLTGDGHADIIVTEERVITWCLSLAEAGFAEAERVYQALDEEDGPRLIFADGTQSIYLADLSGDGLTDLARIRNGEVCYWPNLGYGRFGAKVTMDNAPWFDTADLFSQQRVRLADIDGSGTTDIIYLGQNGVQIYWNQAGNGWSDGHQLSPFPKIDDVKAVQVVDLLGNGTACLVWSSPLPGDRRRPMRYLDLMRGQKPHLLVRVANNLGAETQVRYVPSTRFYLQDRLDGNPWITRLPFPVHVVERVETYDRISRNRFVTRYAYHHGYFDGEEREFRGFGMVEQWDTEEIGQILPDEADSTDTNLDEASFVPPVWTKTWFHPGAYIARRNISNFFAGEYYREPGLTDDGARALLLDDTVLPEGSTVEEEREACRALKGSILRQEVYALDDTDEAEHPYTVSERSYKLKLIQPRGENRHAVFYSCSCNTLDFHYERKPNDPRITHQMSLEVDEFGNVLKALAVGYGRQPGNGPLTGDDKAKQEQLLMTYTETDVTNVIDEPDDYRTPLPCETRTYELTGYDLAGGAQRFHIADFVADDFAAITVAEEINYEQIPDRSRKQKRLIERTRRLYRKKDLSGPLPRGEVDSMALPCESYTLAFTPGLLNLYSDKITLADLQAILENEGRYIDLDGDGHWWIPFGQIFYSPNTNDSFPQELAYARQHFFLPYRFQDPFGQTTTILYDKNDLLIEQTIDPLENRMRADNEYRRLQPELVTDPNGNRLMVAFDALGMVAGSAVMGKTTETKGDNLQRFEPDLTADDIRQFLIDPKETAASLLKNATTRIIYDLHRFASTEQPVYTATLARETHQSELQPGQENKIQISLTYSDGFDREVQTKIQTEPGEAPEREPNLADPTTPGPLNIDLATGKPISAFTSSRWVGNGRTIYNNKGKPVKQYEPFFSATHLFEVEPEMVLTGVTPVLFYDPLGRMVSTLYPNHTYEKVVFDPWQQTTWDVNDTVLQTDPKNDPDVGDFFRRLPDSDYLPAWHTQRIGGTLGPHEQAAASKAAAHADTPAIYHLDALGRRFLTIADNGVDETGHSQLYFTRTELEIEGKPLAVIDALDRMVMVYRLRQTQPDGLSQMLPGYDLAGSQLYQKSMDTGARWTLLDVAGKPIRAWDDRGFQRRLTYDALRRPSSLFVSESGAPEFLAEKTDYGEHKPSPQQTNHRGQVWKIYDSAGIVTNEAYDFKGNLLESRRQFLTNYREQVDWTAAPTLESELFRSRTSYDALNRPVTATTPDDSKIRFMFNEANLLERVETRLRGATVATPFVTDIDYDAKGQRLLIEYGNGVKTTYEYDPLTFRLVHLLTWRNADDFSGDCPQPPQTDWPGCHVQNLHYTYDPMGNVTHIHDKAQQTIFFKNHRVEPSADYTYDAIYQLIKATGREHLGLIGGASIPHSHNDASRVGLPHPSDGNALAMYTECYVYDAVGNILKMQHRGNDLANPGWTRSYTYKEPSLIESVKQSNRLSLTTRGNSNPIAERYVHDVHGNMTRMPHLGGTHPGPNMYWDYRNQLRRTDLGGGGTAYYTYDAAGQRARKILMHKGSTVEERIYLGGFEIYRKRNASGLVLERETLHIMDAQQRIALVETRTQGNETGVPQQLSRYQFGNHLSSASLELDNKGQIISYEEYTPYGSTSYQAVRSQTQTPKRYRYTDKERDEETGLFYYGARYFVPWLGRWTSCDPAGIVDGANLYWYSQNNPVTRVDRTGKNSKIFEPHRKGDIGELNLAQAFDDTGRFEPLAFDPSLSGSQSGGGKFDMAVFDRETKQVLIIDNKAYGETIDEVSAFSKGHFEKNLDILKEQLRTSGNAFDRAALDSIAEGNYSKVVANAYSKGNVGFSEKVFKEGIEVLDVRTGKLYSDFGDYTKDILALRKQAKAAGEVLSDKRVLAIAGELDPPSGKTIRKGLAIGGGFLVFLKRLAPYAGPLGDIGEVGIGVKTVADTPPGKRAQVAKEESAGFVGGMLGGAGGGLLVGALCSTGVGCLVLGLLAVGAAGFAGEQIGRAAVREREETPAEREHREEMNEFYGDPYVIMGIGGP